MPLRFFEPSSANNTIENSAVLSSADFVSKGIKCAVSLLSLFSILFVRDVYISKEITKIIFVPIAHHNARMGQRIDNCDASNSAATW